MAKKDKAVEGEEAPKKKKPIKLIIVLVVAGVGVKMFVLKEPHPTPAQLAAADKAKVVALYNKCAEANDVPTISDLVIEEVTGESKHEGEESTKGEGHTSTTEAAKEPSHTESGAAHGPVLPAEQSVTVNLQDGNFLKIGIAIQLPAGADVKLAKEEGLLAKATDLTLKEVAAHDLKDLVPPAARVKIQQNLSMKTCKETKGTILGVLFTEFVFQEK